MTVAPPSRPEPTRPGDDAASRFAREADAAAPGLVREFYDFLRCNKKWWLTPIIVVLLLVGLVLIIGSSAAAPFIYTLF